MPLTPDQARELLLSLAPQLGTEAIGLVQAHRRVLGQDIMADRDLPPCDRSAMDGYACRAADTGSATPLAVVATIAAGDGTAIELAAGTCARIYTGARVPEGADCVAMQEVADVVDESHVCIRVAATPGQHVLRQGEDARAGTVLLRVGQSLGATQLAVCASVGADPVVVQQTPRVAILPTGSELKAAEAAVLPHELRESNSYLIRALLESAAPAAIRVLPPVGDDATQLRNVIDSTLASCDVLVTIGGASVGPLDMLATTLRYLGASIHAERLLMKPGKPVIVASLGTHVILGLPGSPLACLTATRILLLPLVRQLCGFTDPTAPMLQVRLAEPLAIKPGRHRFVLVMLQVDADAVVRATPVATASVADLVAAGRADGLLECPADQSELDMNMLLPCWLLGSWPR